MPKSSVPQLCGFRFLRQKANTPFRLHHNQKTAYLLCLDRDFSFVLDIAHSPTHHNLCAPIRCALHREQICCRPGHVKHLFKCHHPFSFWRRASQFNFPHAFRCEVLLVPKLDLLLRCESFHLPKLAPISCEMLGAPRVQDPHARQWVLRIGRIGHSSGLSGIPRTSTKLPFALPRRSFRWSVLLVASCPHVSTLPTRITHNVPRHGAFSHHMPRIPTS